MDGERKTARWKENSALVCLEKEIGNQEAQQTQAGDNLQGNASHRGLGVTLSQGRTGTFRLASDLPLTQALVCQPVLESLDLGIRIGQLGLELVG